MSSDHEGADVAEEEEKNHEVAVDAVEDQSLISNYWNELADREKAGW